MELQVELAKRIEYRDKIKGMSNVELELEYKKIRVLKKQTELDSWKFVSVFGAIWVNKNKPNAIELRKELDAKLLN